MRLHLLVVDGSEGEADALVHELRQAGFAPALRHVDELTRAVLPEAGDGPAPPSQSAVGLAVDVVAVGEAPRATPEPERISAQMVAARAALEREELVDRMAPGLWQLGANGATLYANRAMCALLEVDDAAELARRDPASFFVGDGLARLEAAQGERACLEVEIVGARGGRRRAIGTVAALVSARGERSTVRTFTDVTDLQRAQEQSLQAQKLEAIGRLAGGIAHDFNNLLTVVYTCCGLLYRSIPAGDRGLAHVDQIQTAVKRGAALTRQLLAFARHHPMEPVSIDVNDVVNRMANMLRPIIGDDIELRVNVDRGLRPVRADRGRIEQVLMNLALNARDAMPNGGKLVVSTANVALDADAAAPLDLAAGEYALVAVSDTGVGMDEATRARVFEPFFTTKGTKGTGLGLATAFGIMRELGGGIAVESAPGKGATFRLWMPVTKGEEAPAPTTDLPPVSRRGTETVLLVDDDDGIRGSLAEFLRLHGFNVLEARNGAEARDHARRHRGEIHVLVTDVVMPRVGGKRLADALLALRPTLKVLYLSGYSESTILRRGSLDAGVALLQKPFPPEALVNRIHELLAAPT